VRAREQLKKLKDVTPHTLRHTFATTAAEVGHSSPTIAVLLGHKAGNVTDRYVHMRVDQAMLSAADSVSDRIAEMMNL